MKVRCEMSFNIERYIIYGDTLCLYVKIHKPYKNLFGKTKYKQILKSHTVMTNCDKAQSYKNFLNDCIKHIKLEGFKEGMFKKAIQMVKEEFNVSDNQIEEVNLKKLLFSELSDLNNKVFEVEI